MKKSDAVRFVESMVKNFEESQGKPRPTHKQFATAIVNNLVGLGMTPPQCDVMPGSDWAVMKHEWEPEDA